MSEPFRGAAWFKYSWYQRLRNKSDRQRLMFFDTFWKIAWEGYVAREGAEDFECYWEIVPYLRKPEQYSGGGGSDNAPHTLAASTSRNECVDDGDEIPSVEFVVGEARQVIDEIWGQDIAELYVKDYFYVEMCQLGWRRGKKDGGSYAVNKNNVRRILHRYWNVEVDFTDNKRGGWWFRHFFDTEACAKYAIAWRDCSGVWAEYEFRDFHEAELRRVLEKYFKDGKFVSCVNYCDTWHEQKRLKWGGGSASCVQTPPPPPEPEYTPPPLPVFTMEIV